MKLIPLAACAVAVAAVSTAVAQDLPPGILLLSQIKRHVRQELERLPNYACLQTAQRSRKDARSKSGLQPLDTMRLEVLYSDNRELYDSPGGSTFKEDSPAAFGASGLTASGIFATFLRTLFVNDNAMPTWRGEEVLGGRRTVRYDYRVPVMLSGWTIRVAAGAGIAGMKGSFWADPESLDLVRLQVIADDIPLVLELEDASIQVDYARTRIGGRDVMLPQTGEIRLLQKSGEESRSRMEFTHCRLFQAQSTVSFGEPATPAAGAAPGPPRTPAAAAVGLPAGLMVNVKLASAITEKESVGELIQGVVSEDVTSKGKVLIPNGAQVTGRIRLMDRREDLGRYITLGLEFTEIRTADAAFRFFADLQGMDSHPDVQWARTATTSRTTPLPDRGRTQITIRERIASADLPGIGTFFIDGTRFSLPAGFRMTWKTR